MTSLGYGPVYSVVDRILKALASMPLKVYKKENQSRIVAKNHDQYDLIAQNPSPLYTSFNFRRSLFANYLLWGDGFAKIIRHHISGRPIEYQLLAPYDVEVYYNKSYNAIYYKLISTGEVILNEDMIHISDLNLNGLKGMSKIQLHKTGVSLGMSADVMGKKIMENGNFLGGIIEFEKTLTPEQLKKFRTSFKDVYGGMQYSGGVGVLDGGAKFKPLQYNMPLADAEYIQNRNFQMEDICRIFDYPIALMKGADKASYSSLEPIMTNYVQSNLMPAATMFEQELNRKIFRPNNKKYYTKLELKGLLRGDIKSRTEFYKVLLSSAAISPDEIRAAEDMPPIPGGKGKMFFIPANNLVPLDKINDYVDHLLTKKIKPNAKE